MNEHRVINFVLRSFVVLVFLFILTPIIGSFVFSFNVDRFLVLAPGWLQFALVRAIAADPKSGKPSTTACRRCGGIAGFHAAGLHCRLYRLSLSLFGKSVYMALALLPPTIPVVILGLAMLAFLSRIGLSGELYAVMICHIVMCSPFAMAVIRMRWRRWTRSWRPPPGT
jgi:spermidine/putrescine transport system permease protein